MALRIKRSNLKEFTNIHFLIARNQKRGLVYKLRKEKELFMIIAFVLFTFLFKTFYDTYIHQTILRF
jgi:hypothetical protein